MVSRSAVTRLQTLLIIDLIIVALAFGGYYYVQSMPPQLKKAEFKVTDLTIDPAEAGAGQPITISINVTNVGEETGNYSVPLRINDEIRETKTIQLSGGESRIVTFEVTESNEGNYSVEIEGLTGTFVIIAVAPPSDFKVSGLSVSPSEAWVGDPIRISVAVINFGDKAGSYSLAFRVNNVIRENKIIQLAAKEITTVESIVTENSEGNYSVIVGGLTGKFVIVPTGKHTLTIKTSYSDAVVPFTIDGQKYSTPYSALMNVGKHTIVMPIASPDADYMFIKWEGGSNDPTLTIDLIGPMSLVARYYKTGTGTGSGGSSCPSLYVWNGTCYVYVADVSNHGWLGYINCINEDGSIVFWRNNPWDYIPLDSSQLQPSNGYYNLALIQRSDEIFYLDSAYMLVVDHPSNVNVYSTMVEQYLDLNYMGNIYTVSKNPSTPISAVNEKGENVLPQISKIDGIFTLGINGINSPSWNNITWNRLTLNLGNLTGAKQIKLVVRAIVDWGGDPEVYDNWLNSFFAQPVPNGTQPTPPPYMEVKDANGNWVSVPEGRQFPLPPDGVPRTFVVDLTGLFPTKDYELRINNFWNVTFDYVGVDTNPQENIIIQRIDPRATLYQAFSTTSVAAGNFTRYGDVTPLVLNEDDKFVIGRKGDIVSLYFRNVNLAPPPENWTRDFFFYDACWFKDANGNWGFGFGFTVDPLPFHNMSGFPYPLSTESYPYDAAHLSYLQEYNTRAINTPGKEQNVSSKNDAFTLTFDALAFAVAVNFVNFKCYTIYSDYRKGLRKSKHVIVA